MTCDLEQGGDRAIGQADNTLDIAMRQAVDWSITLDDAPDDPALLRRFEVWLAQHPLNADAWAQASHVGGLIAQSRGRVLATASAPSSPKPAATMRFSWQSRPRLRAQARLRVRSQHRARLRRPAALLGIAAAAIVTWLAAPWLMVHARADYITGPAQEREVHLVDGSYLRLAPGSAVRVAYAGSRRQIDLLAGEVYFEVVHNPARPFTVEARSGKVQVLGTGFDICLGQDTTRVAVKHGKVKVEGPNGSEPLIVTTGQWTRLSTNQESERGTVAPTIVGNWTAHQLTAVDQPLSDVLADLRRYYRGEIILTDTALGRRSVTGVFDVTDPSAAARLIAQPVGGTVRVIAPWLIVIS